MKKFFLKILFVGLGCTGAMGASAVTPPAQALPAVGNLPLYFEAAFPGRLVHPAQFIARGNHCRFSISPVEAQLELQKTDATTKKTSLRVMRMQFVGASPQAQIQGAGKLPGRINYLIGSDPAQWRTGVATYARVRVDELYPGVNLVYYGNQRQLEYDFTVEPGATPDVIKIHFDGVDKASIGARGGLILKVGKGEIRQPAPIIYQVIDGVRRTVSGGYRLAGADTVAFAIGKYDGKLPLVIDPVLSFSTYFGGNSDDTAWSVALDTNGFIYMAGQTLSKTFYPTPGAFQTNFAGGSSIGDAFVAKFNKQGSSLIYFTYLGGNDEDAAYALAIDTAGDAYVTGFTISSNFPVRNPIPGGATIGGTFDHNVHAFLADAFVAKLDASGSNLIYSTYLGGAGADAAYGLALDSLNDAYLTGFTYSTNFPTTPNAFQKHLAVTNWAYQPYFNANAFVTEVSASGSNLLYSSYLGGTNYDQGQSIAVDRSNYVYVTGFTASTNFPVRNAATNLSNGYLLNGDSKQISNRDAFVAKFVPGFTNLIAPGFSNLVYSTLLGGGGNDVANHVAVDANGNACVTGWTVSTNFPNTATNVAGLYNGLTNKSSVLRFITNAFLTQITWSGSNAAIGYSAVFGGTRKGIDIGYDLGLDPVGDAFVVGASSTTNFPVFNVPGIMSSANAGRSDAFVIAFNTNCSAILYSGYLGGSGNDYGYSIAMDASTNAYFTGSTASTDFPIFNATQTNRDGSSDAFLAEIGWVNAEPVITNITVQPTNEVIGTGIQLRFSSVVSGTPPLSYHWQLNEKNLVNTTNIFGATNATMTIYPTVTNNSGSFRLVVSNYAGSATSSNIVVTVTPSPVITEQPTNRTVGVGASATFTMNGYAASPYVFQWFKDGLTLTNGTNSSGSTISGATNYAVTISNVHTNDAGNYWFTLTNKYGAVTSSVVTLTVVVFPTIQVEPTNQTVGLGSFVTFVVRAIGTVPLSYQWQKNGNNLLNSGHISGVTASTLSISSAQAIDTGGYSVIITNVEGAVTSAPPAVLTVLTSPLFGNIIAGTNGDFVVSGVGGLSSYTYYVLTSTNLATPLAQWTPIETNQFGNQGQFDFTTTPSTNTPQQFYLIASPP